MISEETVRGKAEAPQSALVAAAWGGLAVWSRNVIGIRRVGRSRDTPGASMGSSVRGGRSGLMHMVHANARTTPAVRAEIARSREATGALAQRYGVSTETVRKWRQRGPEDCRDRSSRPHRPPWKASEEERAVVCALRRATGFPLDDLAFVVRHFLPHLDRDSVYRILKAAGLSRRPGPATPERTAAKFKEHELGFVHVDVDVDVDVDVKHLPK